MNVNCLKELILLENKYFECFSKVKSEIIKSINDCKSLAIKPVGSGGFCFSVKLSTITNNNWSLSPSDYNVEKQKAIISEQIDKCENLDAIKKYLSNCISSKKIKYKNESINIDKEFLKHLVEITADLSI